MSLLSELLFLPVLGQQNQACTRKNAEGIHSVSILLFILSALFYDIIQHLYIANGLVSLYVLWKCLHVSVAFHQGCFKSSHHCEL